MGACTLDGLAHTLGSVPPGNGCPRLWPSEVLGGGWSLPMGGAPCDCAHWRHTFEGERKAMACRQPCGQAAGALHRWGAWASNKKQQRAHTHIHKHKQTHMHAHACAHARTWGLLSLPVAISSEVLMRLFRNAALLLIIHKWFRFTGRRCCMSLTRVLDRAAGKDGVATGSCALGYYFMT